MDHSTEADMKEDSRVGDTEGDMEEDTVVASMEGDTAVDNKEEDTDDHFELGHH